MQFIRKLFVQQQRAQEDFLLRVLPIIHGGFGVYANAVLLAIHADRATADAHCARLRNQQAVG